MASSLRCAFAREPTSAMLGVTRSAAWNAFAPILEPRGRPPAVCRRHETDALLVGRGTAPGRAPCAAARPRRRRHCRRRLYGPDRGHRPGARGPQRRGARQGRDSASAAARATAARSAPASNPAWTSSPSTTAATAPSPCCARATPRSTMSAGSWRTRRSTAISATAAGSSAPTGPAAMSRWRATSRP